MKADAAYFAAFVICAGSAAASDFCTDLQNLQASVGGVELALPGTSNAVTCTQSLMLSGGTQLNCGWPFAYRAPQAADTFEGLVVAVTQCLGDGAIVTTDLNVNHPDFYDLQTFRIGGQEIGVSLKDKAALSETYVFLRVTLPK
ncbi:hypothetical protein [Tateyamaria sp.]|uniref:hypothetical protein n=1 Tax=Tateyamaria sp. TaxID=1929288 RepID=UPI00329FD7D0